MALSPGIKEGPCLDLGCGFGGTIDQMHKYGFHSIHGVDIDRSSIDYARQHYPEIPFYCADATQVSTLFVPQFFSFISLFSVIYAIEDKRKLLGSLSTVAKPGALLALFDYTIKKSSFPEKDLAGKSMFPMTLSSLTTNLEETGWEILQIDDLSSQFLAWYRALLAKIKTDEAALGKEFPPRDILKVTATFTTMKDWLKHSKLGGALVLARRKAFLKT